MKIIANTASNAIIEIMLIAIISILVDLFINFPPFIMNNITKVKIVQYFLFKSYEINIKKVNNWKDIMIK